MWEFIAFMLLAMVAARFGVVIGQKNAAEKGYFVWSGECYRVTKIED